MSSPADAKMSSSARKQPDLYVTVPSRDASRATAMAMGHPQDKLREPITLSASEVPNSSRVSFEDITQLPTPILSNGSFGSYSPVESVHSGTSPIEMSKLRRKQAPVARDRAISEYRPLGRKNSLTEDTKVEYKRIASNPLVKEESPAVSSDFPGQSEIKTARYEGCRFTSVHHAAVYRFEKVIGTGNFSTVVLASNVENSLQRVAVKIISIPHNSKNEVKNFKYFLKRELNILNQLHYPSVIRLLDYNINLSINIEEMLGSEPVESESDHDSDNIKADLIKDYNSLQSNNDQLIFLNYCSGGNLFEFVTKYYGAHHKSLVYWRIMERVVIELLLSVHYIHQNNIIHRDIKPENFLLNYDMETLVEICDSFKLLNTYKYPFSCLTDFGLAKKLTHSQQLISTRCGSQDYIAPEVLMGLKYDGRLTDSWSVGVFIYSLLENRLPFDAPPMGLINQNGVSPSVIRRRMAKNTPAHRIAMIDWDWYAVVPLLEAVDHQTRTIIVNLQALTEKFLVRKNNRSSVSDVLADSTISWIANTAPAFV